MTPEDRATARIAELEADNRRLRRLLDQRDAPGELRHRLRSTVSLLRAIIRQSATTPRNPDDFADHVEGRLDAIARAQAEADERGATDLHKLIADELLQYGSHEGDGLTLAGPAICLQPRAGQLFALAVHELAVNSIEHGALAAGGQIEAEWGIAEGSEGPVLTFRWREELEKGLRQGEHGGFGTHVLTRMLQYELGATTHLEKGPDGVSFAMSLPFTERVGSLSEG